MKIKPMKFTFSLLAIFAVSAGLAHAGSFGGPGPFRNGSSLPSGNDGSYQATARGNNVSGVFRFNISNGMQSIASSSDDGTVSDPANSWVFFIRGEVYRGNTQAGISGTSVSGVLDSDTNLNPDGEITLPIIISSIGANGDFNGKLDQNSPTGYFEGDGNVSSSGQYPETISYTGLFTEIIGYTPPPDSQPIEREIIWTYEEEIPGQPGFGDKTFSFRGTRNSTGTSDSSTTNSSSSQ